MAQFLDQEWDRVPRPLFAEFTELGNILADLRRRDPDDPAELL